MAGTGLPEIIPRQLGYSRIVVHHTASPLTTTLEDVHKWHVEERAWKAPGYHFVIEGGGLVRRARHILLIGAHVRGHNVGSIGIAVAGDNTTNTDRWTTGQIEALERLIVNLQMIYGPLPYLGHRDLDGTSTACPGLNVRELLRI